MPRERQLREWAPTTAKALEGIDEVSARVRRRLSYRALADAQRRAGPGSLGRSIRSVVTGNGFVLTTDHPGAAPRETGEPIKGRPWLAVPLTEAIRATGGPRTDGKLFVLKTRDGRLFLARAQNGRIAVRWRLVDRVQQRHRPFIEPAMREAVAALSDEVLADLRVHLEVA